MRHIHEPKSEINTLTGMIPLVKTSTDRFGDVRDNDHPVIDSSSHHMAGCTDRIAAR